MKSVVLVLFSIVLLTSCNLKSVTHNKELEGTIISIMKEEKTGEIDLNGVTVFAWDQAFIITPYTTNAAVRERTGSKDLSNMEIRDDVNAIIFVEDGKQVQYVEIPRFADFVVVDEEQPVTPENSIVKFEQTN